MRFGTYGGGGDAGNGRVLVPPAGIPEFLACEGAGTTVSCQDLNGDHAVPIGAAVYVARPTANWRAVRSPQSQGGLPRGITFTKPEHRLLIDLAKALGSVTTRRRGPSPPSHP